MQLSGKTFEVKNSTPHTVKENPKEMAENAVDKSRRPVRL
jgi:hypothetical protein